jgi:hypothetical protein
MCVSDPDSQIEQGQRSSSSLQALIEVFEVFLNCNESLQLHDHRLLYSRLTVVTFKGSLIHSHSVGFISLENKNIIDELSHHFFERIRTTPPNHQLTDDVGVVVVVATSQMCNVQCSICAYENGNCYSGYVIIIMLTAVQLMGLICNEKWATW